VKFSFNVAALSWVNPGAYNEYFQPIIEGTPDGAVNSLGTYLRVTLTSPQYDYAFSSQSSYPTINTGQSASVFVAYKNIGTASWYDDNSYPAAPASSKLFAIH